MTDDTLKPVSELSGRELDAAVAEEVMGWTRTTDAVRGVPGPIYLWVTPDGDELSAGPGGWRDCKKLRRYHSDINAAWEVVDKTWDDFALESSSHEADDGWLAGTRGWEGVKMSQPHAYADTAPEAICRAALKAVRSD